MVGTEVRATTVVRSARPMNDFTPWEEWGRLCDSAKCSESTRAALHKFARNNWHVHLADESGGGEPPEAGEVTGTEPWQRFESHCAVKQTAGGKSYKSWLFERVILLPKGTPADKVRSGAYGIIRSVVRDFLRREGRFRLPRFPRPQPSLSDTPPDSTEDLTYEDLLPDGIRPGQDVEIREFNRIAVEDARKIMAELNDRQHLEITAWALGIALSHPEVEALAGCKKSVLSEELAKTFRDIQRKIHSDYAGEDVRGRRLLLGHVMLAVRELASTPENQPETWKARLFSLAADIEP